MLMVADRLKASKTVSLARREAPGGAKRLFFALWFVMYVKANYYEK